MPDKNNKGHERSPKAPDRFGGDTIPAGFENQLGIYRLRRDDVEIAIERSLDAITRRYVRALAREIDDQINRQRREVIVTASRFVCVVRDNISHRALSSFQIIGEPIFEGDLDDTDSLDVSALRRQLNGERSKKR